MSGQQGAWNKLTSGNISGALHDVATWFENRFSSLPIWVQTFLNKTGTQEYNILQNLVSVATKDVVAGGLTTASFVAAGKDVLSQLVAQNISTFTMQDVMANLNMAVAADPSVQNVNSLPAAPAAAQPSPFAATPTPADPAPAPAVADPAPVDAAQTPAALPDNVASHSVIPTT